MYGHCLITTLELMRGITERDYIDGVPKLEREVFCRPARLLYYFVKVLNKSLYSL